MDVLQNGVRPSSNVASSSVSCLLLKSKAFFLRRALRHYFVEENFARQVYWSAQYKDISEYFLDGTCLLVRTKIRELWKNLHRFFFYIFDWSPFRAKRLLRPQT